MYNFCTYFDKNYLLRGMTLFRSLSSFTSDFQFFVACLDDVTFDIIKRLNIPKLIPIPLIELENKDTELLKAKQSRSLVEYYFTLSPILPLYILNNFKEVDVITYLDADLSFYSHPQPIFDEFANKSILIVEHRFPENLKNLEEKGRFNVQCQIFRRDKNGIDCLNWWRMQCLNWCYDRCENGKYADQKYLDQFPVLFDDVVILNHKGAGLAPWNWMQYDIKIKNNKVFIDNEELIFYHFNSLKIIHSHLISHGLSNFGKNMPYQLRRLLYSNYISVMKKTAHWIASKTKFKYNILHTDIRNKTSLIYDILYAIKWRQLMFVS